MNLVKTIKEKNLARKTGRLLRSYRENPEGFKEVVEVVRCEDNRGKLLEKLLDSRNRNPEKFNEVLETAKHTDMDVQELVEHLGYLGDDAHRCRQNLIKRERVASAVGFAGMGAIVLSLAYDNDPFIGLVGVSAVLLSTLYLAYRVDKSNKDPQGHLDSDQKYASARKDAIRNIETRAQMVS